MNTMLRSAVIGMGHIGNLHARIHKEQTVSELVAVCDRDHERADAAAKALGVPAYYDAQEMLDREKPDVVSITTGGYEYSSDHYEPTMQRCARAVTCWEKSPSATTCATRRKWWIWRKNGRVLWHRYEPPLYARGPRGQKMAG